jgi:hypothetical protein
MKISSVFEWRERFRESSMSKSQILIPFLDIKGIVHFEFIPQDQTANQAYYVKILKWLHEARRERPELWPNDWILHHDNAPAHKALSSSFSPKNRLLKWNTHPIPLISLHTTS